MDLLIISVGKKFGCCYTHTYLLTKLRKFLQEEVIDAMDGPARSPDLNPIEHIWDIMSRSIHQLHHRLSMSWRMLSSRSGRRSLRKPFATSSGACPGVVGRSYSFL
jgi:hypothetical protein